MDGLPKLPGLDFASYRIKLRHNVPQYFEYKNGYQVPKPIRCSVGNEPHNASSAAFIEKEDPLIYDPTLTYGKVKPIQYPPFRPDYVIFDKMQLTFKGFFKQSIPESPVEHFRVRYVNIILFLEDNSIQIMEPKTRNPGFPQGKYLRRGKYQKNISGEIITWKDFNLGIDIGINGIVYHVYDCDEYTKDFLISRGVEINSVESPPVDPVTAERKIEAVSYAKARKSKQKCTKVRRSLEYQGKVLRYNCVLDETDRPMGDVITYTLLYSLDNDTMAIKELPENENGRHCFPTYLKRTQVPKNFKRRPADFPAVYLEVRERDVDEYYSPKDLLVGDTIYVYGRKFLLLDCDGFTRKYFAEVLNIQQKPKIELHVHEDQNRREREIPDYIGFGSPEDSLVSFYSYRPKPPKKDVIKYLVNANKSLRYSAILDTAHPEDHIRKFILMYNLADDTIRINEPPIRNSGIIGGKFLRATLIKKPGCDPNMPVYYDARDLYIGAVININGNRFRITGADLFVYKYMKEHPELFSKEGLLTISKFLLMQGNLKDEIREAIESEFSKSEEIDSEPKHIDKSSEAEADLDKCIQQLDARARVEPGDSKPSKTFAIVENADKDEPVGCTYKIKPLSSATKKVEFKDV